MSEKIYDVLILGAGPAGLTAAIYTSRAELSTLVISGVSPLGQLTETTEVENFPGFPNGIMGPQLVQNFNSQAERFGAKIMSSNIQKIEGSYETGFRVICESGGIYYGKTVIIATGASAKWLGLESEQRLRGKGVSACATCDGFFFKGKAVAVVGGGDSAMEEAVSLSKFCSKVYVLVRGLKEDIKASKAMQKKAFSISNIEFIFNVEVIDILGDSLVEGVKVSDLATKKESVFEVSGVFVAIGHRPNTSFLLGFVELDEFGYVAVSDGTKTSKEGVFVAGDVSDYKYRQAVTAAGFGCMAALDVEKFLSNH